MCHQKQGRIKWIEYTGQSIFFGPLLRTHFDIWQTHKMAELVFFKEIFRHQAKKTEKKKKKHFVALKSPLPENLRAYSHYSAFFSYLH